jgi:hypothetical protein
MIYYDKRWLTLHWDETCQAVYAEWKGYVEGDDFRGGLDAGITLLAAKRSSRWLGDTRLMGPVRQVDQKWTNEDWFPRIIAAGLRWLAMIPPQSSIARLSVRNVLSKVNGVDVVTALFDDLESARAWLRHPTKPA